MSLLDEILQSGLESILVLEDTVVDIQLDLAQTVEKIDGRLLIACWWIFQICRCALELKSIGVISQELSRNAGVEGYTGETVECLLGSEDQFCIGYQFEAWESKKVFKRTT